jgi:hypothetical protein
LTVKVTEREGKLQIERVHSEEIVALHDGDRLVWKCLWIADDLPRPCPKDIAFTVKNIHPVANLSWEGSEEEEVNDLVERFESVIEGESAERKMAEDEMWAALPQEALEMLEGERQPFEAMLTDLTTYGGGSIISPPYSKFDHELLWKFEWAVQRGPDGRDRDNWDPHFRGHKKR